MVDDQFSARIVRCVDGILYQWLKQCTRVTYTKETTTALTNFVIICRKMLTNSFYPLPTNVQKLRNRKEDDINYQRKKKSNKNSSRVVNEDMNEYWKLRTREQ